MTDDTETSPDARSGGRTDRFLDRWRDRWQDSTSTSGVLPRPTRQYQDIDWTLVQTVRGESHAGRV